MKVLLQRVSRAAVEVGGATTGKIGHGLLVFVGVEQADGQAQADWLVDKTVGLRIFPDEEKAMNRSLLDVGGEILIVSQFTLAADTSRGNRPGFSSAAAPAEGERLYEFFVKCLRSEGVKVATGRFGADMAVELVNEGPTTVWMDTKST